MPCPAHAPPFHLQEEAKGRQLRSAALQEREQRVPDILRFLHRSPDWRCSCGLCALLAGMPLRKLQPWQRQQVLHYMTRCLWMHVVRRAAACYLGAPCATLWLAVMHCCTACAFERLLAAAQGPRCYNRHSPHLPTIPRHAVDDVLASAHFLDSGSATGSSQCRIPLLPPLQMLGDCAGARFAGRQGEAGSGALQRELHGWRTAVHKSGWLCVWNIL